MTVSALHLPTASDEITIRDVKTGQVYVGKGDVPAGYELVPPPPREPQPYNTGLETFTQHAALPTLGAIGGRALGTALGGLPGGIAGESAGAMAGTGANMALGYEKPSWDALARAGGLPPLVRGVAGIARAGASLLPRILPGGSTALQQTAADEAKKIPDLIRMGTPSGELYTQVEQLNPDIPTTNITAALDKLLRHENRVGATLENDALRKVAEGLKAEFASGQVPFREFWPKVQRLGQRVGALKGGGGEEYGAYKELYRAAQRDLEAATEMAPVPAERMPTLRRLGASGEEGLVPTSQAGATVRDTGRVLGAESPQPSPEALILLRAANQTYKREMAQQDLADFIAHKATQIRKSDDLVYINPGSITKFLRDNEDTFKALDPAERAEIAAFVQRLARTPPLPAQHGRAVGSSLTLARLATGGAFGYQYGGSHGAAVGVLAAAQIPNLIRYATMTPTGRQYLLTLLGRGNTLDFPKLATLATAIRSGALAEPVQVGEAAQQAAGGH